MRLAIAAIERDGKRSCFYWSNASHVLGWGWYREDTLITKRVVLQLFLGIVRCKHDIHSHGEH